MIVGVKPCPPLPRGMGRGCGCVAHVEYAYTLHPHLVTMVTESWHVPPPGQRTRARVMHTTAGHLLGHTPDPDKRQGRKRGAVASQGGRAHTCIHTLAPTQAHAGAAATPSLHACLAGSRRSPWVGSKRGSKVGWKVGWDCDCVLWGLFSLFRAVPPVCDAARRRGRLSRAPPPGRLRRRPSIGLGMRALLGRGGTGEGGLRFGRTGSGSPCASLGAPHGKRMPQSGTPQHSRARARLRNSRLRPPRSSSVCPADSAPNTIVPSGEERRRREQRQRRQKQQQQKRRQRRTLFRRPLRSLCPAVTQPTGRKCAARQRRPSTAASAPSRAASSEHTSGGSAHLQRRRGPGALAHPPPPHPHTPSGLRCLVRGREEWRGARRPPGRLEQVLRSSADLEQVSSRSKEAQGDLQGPAWTKRAADGSHRTIMTR
eukprot:360471-Chlamydomonas_euryale.AAC.6